MAISTIMVQVKSVSAHNSSRIEIVPPALHVSWIEEQSCSTQHLHHMRHIHHQHHTTLGGFGLAIGLDPVFTAVFSYIWCSLIDVSSPRQSALAHCVAPSKT